ncbi:hypothetical protein [Lysinibacillus sp. FSL K6-3209]|uniref:hypothetical protein n=1 Tax=Lysinibacillus sp. FSL K6-3209 TaxID=2921497 RepID=UPI0030D8D1BC
MTEIKWRKGDIIHNRYAGHPTNKYFIYLGVSGRYVNGLTLRKGKDIKECQFYKSSMNEMLDGEPAFQVVGHTIAFDVMKQDLLKFIEEETA